MRFCPKLNSVFLDFFDWRGRRLFCCIFLDFAFWSFFQTATITSRSHRDRVVSLGQVITIPHWHDFIVKQFRSHQSWALSGLFTYGFFCNIWSIGQHKEIAVWLYTYPYRGPKTSVIILYHQRRHGRREEMVLKTPFLWSFSFSHTGFRKIITALWAVNYGF